MSRPTILCKFDSPRVFTEAKCFINLLNNWKRATEEYNTLRMSLQQPHWLSNSVYSLEINLIRKKRVKKSH